MKLSKDLVNYIRNIVKVAKLIGIESAAVEKDLVRAMDENKTVVICHTDDVPDIPFDGIGIGRLDVFSSRFALIDGREGFSTDAEINVKDGTNQVAQLIFKATNIKVEYRCANSTTIKAPKAIKDTMISEFKLNADGVETFVKAHSAMSVDYVTVISNSKGTTFELIDTNSDVFSHAFTDQAVSLSDRSNVEFVHRYPAKTLVSIFKQDPNQTVEISTKGILKTRISGLDVFVLPSI